MPWPFFNVFFLALWLNDQRHFVSLGLINPLDVANGGVWEVIPGRLQTSGCGQDRRFFFAIFNANDSDGVQSSKPVRLQALRVHQS